MVDGYNIGARNQHADSGAYEFHIHRAYIIYGAAKPFYNLLPQSELFLLSVLFCEDLEYVRFFSWTRINHCIQSNFSKIFVYTVAKPHDIN